MDNNIGKRGDIVTVQLKGKVAFCEYCKSNDCVHVKYCWEIPQVAEVLKKHGLRLPDQKLRNLVVFELTVSPRTGGGL